jgi:hypothetical protein
MEVGAHGVTSYTWLAHGVVLVNWHVWAHRFMLMGWHVWVIKYVNRHISNVLVSLQSVPLFSTSTHPCGSPL